MKASDLFELPDSLPFGEFFSADDPPWVWVSRIGKALAAFDFSAQQGLADIPAGVHITGDVYLHPTVQLPPYCVIQGPAFIGPETRIGPGAFIRGNVIAGAGCTMGNSCEYKQSLLMDRVETAHFNYVGDSVMGSRSHLGAGVILANLKLKRDEVRVKTLGGIVSTGMRKLGAMLGEGAEVGCNAVIQPGSILGKKAVVMSTLAFHGNLEAGHMACASEKVKVVPIRGL